MSITAKNSYILEIAVGSVGITTLIFLLRSLLITGETTLVHDNFQWCLPVFHFYARNLSQGSLPLWNPFTHAGEAFYPLLMQLRLLEPLTVATVLIGKFFTASTVILFNWNRFILSLWMVMGLYQVLRRFTSEPWIRLCLIPILLFSSVCLGSFHQDGILSQFLWVPWICLYLLKIFEDENPSWKNILFLSICIGINFQSYQFVGPSLFFLFFCLFVFVFKRPTWNQFLRNDKIYLKLSLSFFMILAMSAPNLVLLYESQDFLYSLRLLPENYKELLLKNTGLLPSEITQNYIEVGLNMPYSLIPYTGAFIKIWEFIQLLTPAANPNIHAYAGHLSFGSPSEAFMYIGILPWLIALWGMCFGVDAWKNVFAALTISFGLLMMGPPGGLHQLLFPILPPLWFIRHTDLFVLFFIFGVLYFFILGMNHLVHGLHKFKLSFYTLSLTGLSGFLIYSLLMVMTALDYPVFKFPYTSYLFIGFLILGASYLIFRKGLGPSGIWLSLVMAQIAIVITYQRDPLELLSLIFILPFTLFFFSPLPRLNRFVISFTILLDLLLAFHHARFLYSAQLNPAQSMNLDLKTNQKSWDLKRKISVTYPQEFFGRPIPRYLSVLMNEPTAFSPLIRFKGETPSTDSATINEYLNRPRWNHFLMNRNYADLLNKNLNDEILSNIFAINQLPFFYTPQHFNNKDSIETLALSPLSTNELSIKNRDYNTLELNVHFKKAGSLYWSDGYDRYWNAYVDALQTPVFRAYTNFKAIHLPEGTHSIRWIYDPYPFKWALGLFYGGPILSLLGLWLLQFLINSEQKRVKKWEKSSSLLG